MSAGGGHEVGLDLSGVGLRVRGLGAELATRLCDECAPFVVDAIDAPLLCVEYGYLDGPPPDRPWDPKAMRSRFAGGAAAFSMAEGVAEVDAKGHARVRMRRGVAGREYHALANFLRACLAWCLPLRGGALLHAAGIVLDGRGYVLVGPSGAGKTTWARLAAGAGAAAVGDDVVLLDGEGPGAALLAAPLKCRFRSHDGPGRWPLAAVLFPRHAERPALAPCPALLARARLTANMTFVGDAVGGDGRVARVVDRLVDAVSCAELAFAPDPAFVELLRQRR